MVATQAEWSYIHNKATLISEAVTELSGHLSNFKKRGKMEGDCKAIIALTEHLKILADQK